MDIEKINEPVPPPLTSPKIVVIAWKDMVRQGDVGAVYFRIDHDRPVIEVRVDLVGDGQDGWTLMCSDGRLVGAMYFRPQVAGTFSLHLYARDAEGQKDATGMTRTVMVTPR